MNPEQNLEQRADSQAGIKIITLCLKQIKSYKDFKNRKKIINEFLKKEYPKLVEADIIGITSMIYNWTRQYEYSNKDSVNRPSTMEQNSFIFGTNDNIISKIIELIKSNEKEYLISLNSLYPEYS